MMTVVCRTAPLTRQLKVSRQRASLNSISCAAEVERLQLHNSPRAKQLTSEHALPGLFLF